jgi:hypothetical protein
MSFSSGHVFHHQSQWSWQDPTMWQHCVLYIPQNNHCHRNCLSPLYQRVHLWYGLCLCDTLLHAWQSWCFVGTNDGSPCWPPSFRHCLGALLPSLPFLSVASWAVNSLDANPWNMPMPHWIHGVTCLDTLWWCPVFKFVWQNMWLFGAGQLAMIVLHAIWRKGRDLNCWEAYWVVGTTVSGAYISSNTHQTLGFPMYPWSSKVVVTIWFFPSSRTMQNQRIFFSLSFHHLNELQPLVVVFPFASNKGCPLLSSFVMIPW